MVDPERQRFVEWVRLRGERLAATPEERARAKAKTLLREAEEKRKRDEWRRSQEEDAQYLRESIAWEVFKDAQVIMMTHLVPAKILGIKIGEKVSSDISCEIRTPNYYPNLAHIELRWEEKDHPGTGSKVLCTVARHEGTPIGFLVTYSGVVPFGLSVPDEVIPPDDREKLSTTLRQAIINAPRAAFDPCVV